jgi:hypothetical protein
MGYWTARSHHSTIQLLINHDVEFGRILVVEHRPVLDADIEDTDFTVSVAHITYQ